MTLLSKLSLTSDRDYLKILDDGQILVNANGTPDADSTFPYDMDAPFGYAGFQEITHNLGSIPLVRAFYDPLKNGKWYSVFGYKDGGGFPVKIEPWLKYIVTTTTLKLIMNTDGSADTNLPVFYRIYDLGEKSADSDSRIDKIFLKDSSSGSVAGSASSLDQAETILTIPHGAGEAPLWSLQFAESASGPWYGEGNQIIGPYDTGSGPPGGPYARYYYTQAFGAADDTNFYAYLQSNYSSAKTVYVRFALDYRQ